MIGLTGGIGSGKSTIARELARRGYHIYDTDSEAKRIIDTDSVVRQRLTDLLGEDIWDGGIYRRDVVAARVFGHPALLAQLNQIVHPAVATDVVRVAAHTPALVVESAILYQSGLDRLCDRVVAVVAPEQIRLERAMRRDKADISTIRARMRAQMNDDELRLRADIVVLNDGTYSIEQLVTQLIEKL